METKSAIAMQTGGRIKAIMCETGDYVDLAPRLQQFWNTENVTNLIAQGNQEAILDDANVPSKTFTPALTFFSFEDFMRHFEGLFCEEYYILADGIWYYASAGARSVTLLDIKIKSLTRARPFDENGPGCVIHGHVH